MCCKNRSIFSAIKKTECFDLCSSNNRIKPLQAKRWGLQLILCPLPSVPQPVLGVQRLQILWDEMDEMGEVSLRSKDLESETMKVTPN